MGAAVFVFAVGFLVDFFVVVLVDVFVAAAFVAVVLVPVPAVFVAVVFPVVDGVLLPAPGSDATGLDNVTAPAGVTPGCGRPAFWAAASRSATTH